MKEKNIRSQKNQLAKETELCEDTKEQYYRKEASSLVVEPFQYTVQENASFAPNEIKKQSTGSRYFWQDKLFKSYFNDAKSQNEHLHSVANSGSSLSCESKCGDKSVRFKGSRCSCYPLRHYSNYIVQHNISETIKQVSSVIQPSKASRMSCVLLKRSRKGGI